MTNDEIIEELITQKVAIIGILRSLTKNQRQIDKFMSDCNKNAKEIINNCQKDAVLDGQMSIFDLEKEEK